MRESTYRKLQLLARCTFRVGSYNKRFIGNLSLKSLHEDLTDKQIANVDRLYWRYRRQIKPMMQANDPPLVRVLSQNEIASQKKQESDKRAKAEAKLAEWNRKASQ